MYHCTHYVSPSAAPPVSSVSLCWHADTAGMPTGPRDKRLKFKSLFWNNNASFKMPSVRLALFKMNFSTFNVTAVQCIGFLKKEREAAAVGWQPTKAENKRIPALTELSIKHGQY